MKNHLTCWFPILCGFGIRILAQFKGAIWNFRAIFLFSLKLGAKVTCVFCCIFEVQFVSLVLVVQNSISHNCMRVYYHPFSLILTSIFIVFILLTVLSKFNSIYVMLLPICGNFTYIIFGIWFLLTCMYIIVTTKISGMLNKSNATLIPCVIPPIMQWYI